MWGNCRGRLINENQMRENKKRGFVDWCLDEGFGQGHAHENKMFDARLILVSSAASFMNLSAASIGV